MDVDRTVLGDGAIGGGVGGVVTVRLLEGIPVELGRDVVLGVQLPVNLGKEDALLEQAGKLSLQGVVVHAGQATLEVAESGEALGCSQRRGAVSGGSRRDRLRQVIERAQATVGAAGHGGRRDIQNRIDLAEAVIGEEEEELVFLDGAADRAAVLMLLVDRLGEVSRFEGRSQAGHRALRLDIGVQSIQVRIAQQVEQVAVKGVGAGLGDGVNLSAGGLAQRGRVCARGRLELLDRVARINIRSAAGATTRLRKEGLVVVGAVDEVGVVKRGDATVGDETAGAVGSDVGRHQHHVVKAAAVDGHAREQFLADFLRSADLLGVDQGRIGGNDHRILSTRHR